MHHAEVVIPCLQPSCSMYYSVLLTFSQCLQTKERKDKEQGQEHGYNEQSKATGAGTR
jgi:hypothetical protein